ncbi:MAG: gliding motility-associated C-terminal domain-containing protein [Bacteroidales bacterium]|nr:gliding motility-associated C-terminal domain-containing protein [Bacteroidales bacterium]
MLNRIKYILIIFISLTVKFNTNGQLFHGSADYGEVSTYVFEGVTDSLFIFYSDNDDPYITAASPNGNVASFEWSIYDRDSGNFQFYDSDTGINSHIELNPETGSMCFRVSITGGGNDSTARCWVLFNNYRVTITTRDGENKIPDSEIACGRIKQIRAEIDSAQMSYINLNDDSVIPYENDYSDVVWSNSEGAYVSPSTQLVRSIRNPYWEDSYYIITITDGTGYERSDSVWYESIEPYANFSYEYIHLNDEEYYPDRSDRYYEIYDSTYEHYSAPAMYLFDNESENADSVVWFFGDSLWQGSNEDSVMHTYLLPGTYYPYLVAYNKPDFIYDPCTDTIKFEELEGPPEPVYVEEPFFQDNSDPEKPRLPNVFTPPSGSQYFRFEDASIGMFEIAIYNRYGKKVHYFKGNIRDWEGWDGTYKESDKTVATGVYFWVIKVMERLPNFDPEYTNENQFGEGHYRGFVHVYNTE